MTEPAQDLVNELTCKHEVSNYEYKTMTYFTVDEIEVKCVEVCENCGKELDFHFFTYRR